MQRIYPYLVLVLFIHCKQASDKNNSLPSRRVYDYCYSNKSGLYVSNAGDSAGTHIKLLATDVQLSPDGTYLAYTDINSPDHERRIGLMDLSTRKTVLLDTACVNCYGPVWSPDGDFLAYNAMKDGKWNIKYVDRENTHAAFIIKRDTSAQLGYFSPQWGPDSKSIIAQDMAGVYSIDLNGNFLQTIEMNSIDTAILPSSSSQFLMTKDNKLIYDAQSSTDTSGEDEPPGHIFSYDINTKKLIQLTPGGYSCYHPVIKGDTIFCQGADLHSGGGSSVYSMDVNGAHFREVFKHCHNFSCRTKP